MAKKGGVKAGEIGFLHTIFLVPVTVNTLPTLLVRAPPARRSPLQSQKIGLLRSHVAKPS